MFGQTVENRDSAEKASHISFGDYQLGVLRTVQDCADLRPGLIGESGELIDLWKKVKIDGHEVERERVIEEAGDVLWYLCAWTLLDDLGIAYHEGNEAPWWPLHMGVYAMLTGGLADEQVMAATLSLVADLTGDTVSAAELFSEIARANLEKLKRRHPDGYRSGGGIRD